MSEELRFEVNPTVTEQLVTQDAAGRYVAVAVATNGWRWEVDITALVETAAAHRLSQLEEDNGRLSGWLQQYVERYGCIE